MAVEIANGVFQIDTKLGGWDHVTSAYLIDGDAPVLIEVGSQSSVKVVLQELSQLGVGSEDLATIALTHIHLDHAGGTGEISKAFPKAQILVHERGARHLADPSRLNTSAALVYGDLLESLYGRLEPTPAERIDSVGGGDLISVSKDRSLVVIDSPGHAKHHLGFFDPLSGILFTGDAAGVLLPGLTSLRPATPPADFDAEKAFDSLGKFKSFRPNSLAFAHYGLYDRASEILDEADESLRAWVEVAKHAFCNGLDIESELTSAFAKDKNHTDEIVFERLDLLNGVHSNAMGLKMWLESQEKSKISK